jgi:histone H4
MGKAAYGSGKMRGKMGGKMGKHRGKGGMRVVDIDNWKGLTDPAIRRLLRKGGVTRTNTDIYDEARGVTKSFLTMILKDAIAYTDHARRKTITAVDIKYSLDRNKITYYPCGTDKKKKKASAT